MSPDAKSAVFLSVNRALLGAIGSNVRAITCFWTDQGISIRVIFDGAIGENDFDTMSVVETEVMADFPDHDVSVVCDRIDAPQIVEIKNGSLLIFERREDPPLRTRRRFT
jgi:hypothetical protein